MQSERKTSWIFRDCILFKFWSIFYLLYDHPDIIGKYADIGMWCLFSKHEKGKRVFN